MTIQQAYHQLLTALEPLYGSGEARSIARIVFEDAFGIHNFNRKDTLSPEQQTRLLAITTRLLAHEPVQYIIGMADFYGLRLKVDPHVLIPRPETEELVLWMLETLERMPLKVLDIGTGSGCIPVALKKERPEWEAWAVDISREALELARENARLNGVEVYFLKLDILDETQWARLARFDAIVSNPPYIPEREASIVPENVRSYEPHRALFVGDEDPLVFYREITLFASRRLTPGGWLFFEANEFNAGEVLKIFENQGFEDMELKEDLSGKERMARARKRRS
ncbi:MAG: peptide chain release factor N(5)-glutamine methyltransferase [Phaeodactylibacter sp.]|nr:peptide chain release factor N(5)-glutamine methyltransferase [Phaeodactylibacter sp.]